MRTEIRNAVIESVSLGTDEHGGMTFWLMMNYDHSSQGFGSFGFGPDNCPPQVFMHLAVREILRVVGVSKWEDLKGKSCRVEIVDGLAQGVGHFIKDEWFRPKEAYAPYIDREFRIQQTTYLARDAKALMDLFVKAKGEEFAAECFEVRMLRERLAKIGGTA